MDKLASPERRLLLASAAAALLPAGRAMAQQPTVANIATIGEPNRLSRCCSPPTC